MQFILLSLARLLQNAQNTLPTNHRIRITIVRTPRHPAIMLLTKITRATMRSASGCLLQAAWNFPSLLLSSATISHLSSSFSKILRFVHFE